MALTLLLAINLFNYIDRQVLAAVEPEIREELFPENPDYGKKWTGLLPFAFLLTYMTMAPVFGWLADRMSRWLLIGIAVILWSLASAASGVDWGPDLWAAFWILLVTRCFVGIGEAAYGPVAPAMLADFYPVQIRGQVMAWFFLAIPVGGALGYALGGQVAASSLGWRWAFYLVLPPGALLGLFCFLMRDPRPGQADPGTVPPARSAGLKDYLSLTKIPSYVFNTLGMTAMTFSLNGLAYWMPAYLKELKVEDVGPVNAKTFFGGLSALAGLIATLAGGVIGDRLRARFSGSYFLVSGLVMLAGFPVVLLFLWTPFPWAWVLIFLAVFCLFFNTGPTNTILANVTHPSLRASAFGLNILVIHLFGDAISPELVGLIAAFFGPSGLKVGFAVVSVMMLVGGVLWLCGARYLERDTKLAPARLDVG